MTNKDRAEFAIVLGCFLFAIACLIALYIDTARRRPAARLSRHRPEYVTALVARQQAFAAATAATNIARTLTGDWPERVVPLDLDWLKTVPFTFDREAAPIRAVVVEQAVATECDPVKVISGLYRQVPMRAISLPRPPSVGRVQRLPSVAEYLAATA